MARRSWIVAGIVGCLVAAGAAGVLVALGLGGVAWFWITGDGSLQRAQRGAEINRRLHVTVESVAWRGTTHPAEGAGQPNACRLVLENAGDRTISRVEGTVLLLDSNGWTVFSCGVDEPVALQPHSTVTIERTLDFFGYKPSSGDIDTIDVARLERAFNASAIRFDDGSSIEVFTDQGR